jgi:S-adenosylmethionine decarboxylase
MAYLDTLFQLGMDLTRSSTAQKEDHGVTARVAHSARPVHRTHEDRTDDSIERNSIRFAGQHLILDLHDADRLDDIEHVESTLRRCVEVAGATLLHVHLHQDMPSSGVSGVAVVIDGHISVQTRPAAGFAAFDVFMDGHAKPQRTVAVLREAFRASEVVIKEHTRGERPARSGWQIEPAKKTVRVRRARAA